VHCHTNNRVRTHLGSILIVRIIYYYYYYYYHHHHHLPAGSSSQPGTLGRREGFHSFFNFFHCQRQNHSPTPTPSTTPSPSPLLPVTLVFPNQPQVEEPKDQPGGDHIFISILISAKKCDAFFSHLLFPLPNWNTKDQWG